MLLKKWIPLAITCTTAWALGPWIPLLGAPVLAILVGALLSGWATRCHATRPMRHVSKKMLLAAVVFLGLSLDSRQLGTLQTTDWFFMILTVLVGISLTGFWAWRLKVQGATGLLVAVGTSICGGSAIAAVAGVTNAQEEETAQALSTIFLYNIIAAVLFPILGHGLGMDPHHFGKWAGTAINDTSSVLAATFVYGGVAGAVGMQVKMARTLMILPVSLGVACFQKHQGQQAGHWRHVMPWPALGFALAVSVRFLLPHAPTMVWETTNLLGQVSMVIALGAIGLGSPLKTLWGEGRPALVAGGLGWVTLAGIALLTT